MTTEDIPKLLTRAINATQLATPALVVAIAVAIAILLVGVAVIITAKQGRADVKISINVGQSRRRPP